MNSQMGFSSKLRRLTAPVCVEIIAVVEMSQSSWLVAGIERQPRKKLEPSAERLLGVLHRWRDEAVKAGRKITRIALAFEAGRDGFWLAR
jgi:transposase